MSYTIPIQSVDKDFYALIKRGIKEIDASSILAVKIHLIVTIDKQMFTFDQVINSPTHIIKTTKEAINKIAIKANGTFTEQVDFLADIFLKNHSEEFILQRTRYLRTTTGELCDGLRTEPLSPNQLLEWHLKLNKEDPFPLLDDEQKFILDQNGIQIQQPSSWFCTLI